MIPSLRAVQRGTLRHVVMDVNFWKTFVHTRLGVGLGASGCLSLWGDKRVNHRLFAEHVTKAELWRVQIDKASGRSVAEWEPYPNRPDNHWFDCLVGCTAAASMEGIALEGMKGLGMPPKRRVVVMPARRG
jgi:hypothetical protein